MELIKKENEELKSQIKRLQKELDDLKRSSINNNINESTVSSYSEKREKRATERRISELEEDVKKMEGIKQDNLRLKEENAALIRVISKLSK
jgi:polyhydroxyalkanoate synthesis regulator phasin